MVASVVSFCYTLIEFSVHGQDVACQVSCWSWKMVAAACPEWMLTDFGLKASSKDRRLVLSENVNLQLRMNHHQCKICEDSPDKVKQSPPFINFLLANTATCGWLICLKTRKARSEILKLLLLIESATLYMSKRRVLQFACQNICWWIWNKIEVQRCHICGSGTASCWSYSPQESNMKPREISVVGLVTKKL